MLNSAFGYSNLRKIIKLDCNNTLTYLCYQLLDIAHDLKIDLTQDNIHIIADLQSTWIYHNNALIQPHTEIDILRDIIKTEATKIIKTQTNANYAISAILGNEGMFRENNYMVKKTDDLAYTVNFIVDQCPDPSNKSKASIYCNNLKKFIKTSCATAYDSGSAGTNCEKIKLLKHTGAATHKVSFNSKYYNLKQTEIMFSCAIENKCVGNSNKKITDIYRGYSITGCIQLGNKNMSIVIADMSVGWQNFKNADYMVFYHTISHLHKYKSTRCFSPYTKNVKILFDDYIKVSADKNDKLKVYTELMAKQWGDLSMICEAVGNEYYVMSEDNGIKLMCAFFGNNYSNFDKVFTKRKQTPVPEVIYEDNPNSIFDRY